MSEKNIFCNWYKTLWNKHSCEFRSVKIFLQAVLSSFLLTNYSLTVLAQTVIFISLTFLILCIQVCTCCCWVFFWFWFYFSPCKKCNIALTKVSSFSGNTSELIKSATRCCQPQVSTYWLVKYINNSLWKNLG